MATIGPDRKRRRSSTFVERDRTDSCMAVREERPVDIGVADVQRVVAAAVQQDEAIDENVLHCGFVSAGAEVQDQLARDLDGRVAGEGQRARPGAGSQDDSAPGDITLDCGSQIDSTFLARSH